jgi:vanillate O-demethylase monooxygenase subunit
MGDDGAADEKLIPRAIPVSDENWHFGTGFLDYDADYQLINDNLTDFSHLSFTHANSFMSGLNWALSRPNITSLDRGIEVERWVENDPVPPYLQGDFNSVDQYVRYQFLAPGILFLSTEIHPGSSSIKYPLGEERPEPLFATFSAQAVTPVDEKSSRYFFSWGPRRVDGDVKTASVMMDVALRAFAEDKEIIEAQQKIIDRDPDRMVMPISADKGVILFQRIMGGLRKAEAQA